jgi:hypothetical protein
VERRLALLVDDWQTYAGVFAGIRLKQGNEQISAGWFLWFTTVLTLIIICIQQTALWNLPVEELTRRGHFIDDAFFYTVIADNFLRTGSISFDGTQITNGFQPLWWILITTLSYLSGTESSARLLPRLSLITFLISVPFVMRVARSWGGGLGVVLVVPLILLNPGFQSLVLRGLETPLVLVLFTAFLSILRAFDRPAGSLITNGRCVLVAVIAGTLFLARTDWFVAATVIGAALVLRRSTRLLLPYGVVLSGLVIPYLAANYLLFDSIVPISGRIKSFYVRDELPSLALYLASAEWSAPFTAFASTFGWAFLAESWVTLLPPLLFLTIALWLSLRDSLTSIRISGWAIVCHILALCVWHRELRPYAAYYFAPEVVWCVLILGRGARLLAPKVACRWKPIAILFFAAAILLCLSAPTREPVPYWDTRLELARYLRDEIPPDTCVAAPWPGALAEFSGRRITPLDGLVGGTAYFERHLKSKSEVQYLDERNCTLLAVYLPDTPDRLFGNTTPRPNVSWPDRHIVLLWENRARLFMRRRFSWDESGRGWYLVELSPSPQ